MQNSFNSKLRPVVNMFLLDKPINLPEKLTPLVAAPGINIISTTNGKFQFSD